MPDGRPWPRFSIVTPSFNQGVFLEEAIRSVLLQGYPGVELVVVDGGSSDHSVDIIRKYEPWLTWWVTERDAGPASALNKGFAHATGELLGFLNADDFLLPRALRVLAREFRVYPSADVISGHGYFAKPSSDLGMATFSDEWDFQRFAYGACVLLQQATFFRRTMFREVPGFSERSRTCWDQELWGDMALAGARFHLVNEFLAAFRLHPGSITGDAAFRERRLRDARSVLEKVRGRPETAGDRLRSWMFRLRKFSSHPQRTVTQRMYFYSTLKRWAL